jgi:hypothetical protein
MGQKLIVTVATIILIITGILLGYVLSQLVLGFLQLSLFTFLGTFSLMLIFGTLYYVLFWEFKRRQSASPPPPASPPPQAPPPIQDNARDTRLKNKLLELVGGDTNVADRLIEQAKQDYPGMPEMWYRERVIADLERDR